MSRTRTLLTAGAAAGPFFYASVVVQMLTRPGFDIRRHPLSLLSLGDWGWVQVATFILTGVGAIAFALGVRRALGDGRSSRWGPALLGLWGVGMILAGVFPADPSLGFPPGTPAGTPDHMSWHSTLHGVGFVTAFSSLVAACGVFARRFAGLGRRGWVTYSVATAVCTPIIVTLGMTHPTAAALPFAAAGVVAFGWVSALALHLLAGLRESTFLPLTPDLASAG